MKSKLIVLSIAAAALSFTACNKGVSEETNSSIATFEASWTETGTMATNWSNDLTATYTKCKEHCDNQANMMTSMPDKMKKDQTMMTKLTELDNADKANLTALESMTNEWNTFKTTWETNTADYAAWKEKVTKGEVTNDEAVAAMTEWNSKLENAKTQLGTWNTAFASTKENTEKTMAACDAMMAPPTPGTPPNKTK